jgi:predicted phage tail protein
VYKVTLGSLSLDITANTPREALSIFQSHLPQDVRQIVQVSGIHCAADLDDVRESGILDITPKYFGAGGGSEKGSWLQIGLGVLLIVTAPWAAGVLTAAGFGGATGVAAGTIATFGFQLALGGAIALLNKAPKADPTSGDKKSRFINGNANTIKEGTPIPLIYGLQKVYLHFLSFDLDSKDYNPA